jgi:hypothetical protein
MITGTVVRIPIDGIDTGGIVPVGYTYERFGIFTSSGPRSPTMFQPEAQPPLC